MKQIFQDSVWRVRDFRRLALGRSVALAGATLVTIVQLLRLTAQGGGPDVIMLLLLAEALPSIALAGLIGQVVIVATRKVSWQSAFSDRSLPA